MRGTAFLGNRQAAKKITVRARPRPDAAFVAREITAEMFGRWAVHRSLDDNNAEIADEWSVTHAPSGLAAATHMDRATALRLADIFRSLLDVEQWDPAKHTPIAEREILRIRGWL